MRVWMWPKSSRLNMYNDLLSDSLSDEGLDIQDLEHGKLMLKVGRAKAGDIVHVHWIHHAYQHPNFLIFLVKACILLLTLTYLKLRRVGVVWTIHNLYPHHVKYPRMERLMRTIICKYCRGLIVASQSIKRKVIDAFHVSPGKVHVVKHGHYLDVYKPQGISIRERYGIGEDGDVLLFMGAIKAYKGVEELVQAFNRLKERNTYLIIAGKADPELRQYLQSMEDSRQIIQKLEFIPNEEVADLLLAADIMVLPYKEITTSGSAILGLSFKKLVVMPDNEFIDEYFLENMVVRYDPSQPSGLENALKQARNLKGERNAKSPNYEEALLPLEWSAVAKKTKQVYQGWG
ncbi:glycosyltransferase family 4 protein [Paenibacillus sp. HB172176]|uniref:glycosyltransferase family 4 protein n=1 Tax=Paenibacillus sp. HB172176 TaxID=2493690 RepID=UPI00143A4EDD|nr:glycosyltransferase family 4 protein [Paenibacillus sp. HB172176]